MASRNIALQITIGGVEQSIQSIEELEIAIREATLSLKQFSGSPEEREKLVNQIKNANSQLKEFKKEIQGVTVDQQIGKFLQLGSLITSTFGAASTVIQSLGVDSENFAQAQAKAQQILTLAFTASEIAKQKDTIATIRNTAAKIANTFATQGLVGVTRLLFTTIKANPMGAFLTLVTAVVSAIVAFGSQTKKTTEDLDDLTRAQQNYNQAAAQGAQTAMIQYESVLAVNTAYLAGQITLEEYTRTLEQLLPKLENINKNSREGRGLILEYTEAQLGLAQVEAEIGAEREILSAAIKQRNDEEATASRQRIQNLAFEAIQFQNTISKVEEINRQNGEAEIEREKKLKEAKDALLKLREQELLLRIRQFEIENSFKTISGPIAEGESQIQKALEEKLQVLKSVVQEGDRYANVLEKTNKILEETVPEEDSYLVAVSALRENVEEQFDLLARGETNIQSATINIREYFKNLAENSKGVFSEEQIENFRKYTEGYANVFQAIGASITDGSLEEIANQFFFFEQAIIDSAIGRGELSKEFDPFGEGWYKRNLENLDGIKRTQAVLFDDLQTAEQRLLTFRENAINAYTKKLVAQEGIYKNNETAARSFATSEIDGFLEVSRNIVIFEGGVKQTARTIENLRDRITELRGAVLESVILSDTEDFMNQFDVDLSQFVKDQELLFGIQEEIRTKNFDSERKYASEVLNLQFQLSEKIPGFAQLSYEAKLMLLKEYLEKEVEETEDAEKKKRDSQQKTIDKFLSGIQQFQTALQALQQAVSDYYNFQFDQLDKRNKRIQDSIVGESERANELRLEADKAYQAERERLEKKQARTQLRLTLAQTVANVAQAVAQNLGNPLVAGIVLAAGAAQVAVVNAQLRAIDSYRRGGRIKKMEGGGMVSGPSHEQGGVKFQGGGIELEGNEAVINRVSTLRYQDILNSINISGGGRPIMNTGFDDSRIVEAIAKQRQEPIRAYVIESDITNAQTINKRLELLSQI